MKRTYTVKQYFMFIFSPVTVYIALVGIFKSACSFLETPALTHVESIFSDIIEF